VGPSGRIIGVDLTDAMLAQAQRRVASRGWSNVELVQREASTYAFPAGVAGILSTFALTHCPAYDAVVEHGAAALRPEGRWVVLDLKEPTGWAPWAVAVGLAVTKPFGVTLSAGQRHPWEALQRHLPHTSMREVYGGIAYVATGRKAAAEPAAA
jgi:demethylmenaquinone methyltransferase/2-methoxy-6-polyprenyl-1,4-benzoquinol methylase